MRWIVDDALKFSGARSAAWRRYDGIMLDPPKFGRGPDGEIWELYRDLPELVALARALLDENSSFLVLTVYAHPHVGRRDRRTGGRSVRAAGRSYRGRRNGDCRRSARALAADGDFCALDSRPRHKAAGAQRRYSTQSFKGSKWNSRQPPQPVPPPPMTAWPAALGHPLLLQFDRLRDLLVQTGLPPEPDVYDLFWRYLGGLEHAITRALDEALAAGPLDMAAVKALRRDHCGEIDASAIAQLVETAREQTDRLSQHLRDGQADLAIYGRAIADGDAALNGVHAPATAGELAALIQPLGAATTVMVAANRRMETELEAAAAETAALRDQLRKAENAAVTDALTGLLNRRGLIEALSNAQTSAAKAVPRLRSRWSTSTTSRTSTTNGAMRWATRCCALSASIWRSVSATPAPSDASAARSSSRSCPA